MPILKEALIAIALLFGLLISPLSGTQSSFRIQSSGAVNTSGHSDLKWLHTNGTHILDEDGNTVILRGANFMGYEFNALKSRTEADYAKMASWGFNVVRLPIAWHLIEPQPGIYSYPYLEVIDMDIRWAKKHGMYVILDMHQWNWSPHFAEGNGMPTWLVNDYAQTKKGYNQATIDFWEGLGSNGTTPSTTNPSMQNLFASVWKMIASRYKGEPTIAGYDILNEPPLEPLYHRRGEVMGYYQIFCQKIVDTIRSIDQKHVILCEPWGPIISQSISMQFPMLNGINLGASFHFYHFRQNYKGDKIWLREMFDTWWGQAIKDSPWPVWVGEIGCFENVPGATQWLKDMIDIFDELHLGWAFWTYWKSDTYTSAISYAVFCLKKKLLERLRQ